MIQYRDVFPPVPEFADFKEGPKSRFDFLERENSVGALKSSWEEAGGHRHPDTALMPTEAALASRGRRIYKKKTFVRNNHFPTTLPAFLPNPQQNRFNVKIIHNPKIFCHLRTNGCCNIYQCSVTFFLELLNMMGAQNNLCKGAIVNQSPAYQKK